MLWTIIQKFHCKLSILCVFSSKVSDTIHSMPLKSVKLFEGFMNVRVEQHIV